MSESFSRSVVLDATVLSNYASTDSVSWLTTTLDALQTVPAVRTELEQGREVGYAYLEHAIDVLESGRIGIIDEWEGGQLELPRRVDRGGHHVPTDSRFTGRRHRLPRATLRGTPHTD